jgi:hypothetical protein
MPTSSISSGISGAAGGWHFVSGLSKQDITSQEPLNLIWFRINRTAMMAGRMVPAMMSNNSRALNMRED